MKTNKRMDVMVDIETLGKKADSTITQISAIAFDIRTGVHYLEFNQIADIEKNKELKVDGDSLKWWLNTDKELLTELLNKGEETGFSSEQVLHNFYQWLHVLINTHGQENIYLWGNGILFDNKMIQYQLQELGLDYPIHYKNDRDVRTIVDLAGAKLGISEKELKSRYEDDSLVEHNAIDDVKFQIGLTVGCYNEIIKDMFDGKVIKNNCVRCGEKLDKSNDYHQTWGACNHYCYGEVVGEYV